MDSQSRSETGGMLAWIANAAPAMEELHHRERWQRFGDVGASVLGAGALPSGRTERSRHVDGGGRKWQGSRRWGVETSRVCISDKCGRNLRMLTSPEGVVDCWGSRTNWNSRNDVG